MLSIPAELRANLRRYQQEHVLTWWERLDDAERQELLEQLHSLDFEELRQLYLKRAQPTVLPQPERIEPVPFLPQHGPEDAARRAQGEEALRRGEVAVLLVA